MFKPLIYTFYTSNTSYTINFRINGTFLQKLNNTDVLKIGKTDQKLYFALLKIPLNICYAYQTAIILDISNWTVILNPWSNGYKIVISFKLDKEYLDVNYAFVLLK